MSKRTFSDTDMEPHGDHCGYGHDEDNRLGINTPFYSSTPADPHYGYGNLHAGWEAFGFTFRSRGGGMDASRRGEDAASANVEDGYENVDASNTAFSHERNSVDAADQTIEEPARAGNTPRYDYEDAGNAANYSYPTPVAADDIHRHYYDHHDHNAVAADDTHHHQHHDAHNPEPAYNHHHDYYHNHTPAPPSTPPHRPSSSTSNLTSSTPPTNQPIWHTATTHFRTPPLSAATLALPSRSTAPDLPFPPTRRLLADTDALALPPPASESDQPLPTPRPLAHEPLAPPPPTIDRAQRQLPWTPRPAASDAQPEAAPIRDAEYDSVAERLRALVDGSMWRRGWGWGERGVWGCERAVAEDERLRDGDGDADRGENGFGALGERTPGCDGWWGEGR